MHIPALAIAPFMCKRIGAASSVCMMTYRIQKLCYPSISLSISWVYK